MQGTYKSGKLDDFGKQIFDIKLFEDFIKL